ncbi:MAG: hypothetical protein ABMB14_04735 [Myxococcota bacterium]
MTIWFGWFGATASAQEVGGFVEVRGTGYLGVDGTPWQLVERVRPEVDAPLLGDRLALGVAVEAALAQGRSTVDELQRTLDASEFGPLLALADCAWPTHANEALRVDAASDYLSVERLYVDAYLPAIDLRVGRQAINWGSARFFNPTDPFPEVLLSEPWRPRRGVNAVRATIPIGERHQVQLVGGANDTFTAERAAARATLNAAGTDLSLAGAWRGEVDEALVGLDVRGTLGVGFWVEGSIHHRPDEVWEELAVGVDYSFPVLETLLLTAQYYRNGRDADAGVAGLTAALEPPVCAAVPAPPAAPAADPFAPFVTGRDYGFLAATLAVTRDLSVNAAALQSLDDGTGFVFPTVTVAPTGALEVSIAAQVPYGLTGRGEFRPAPDDLVVTGDQLAGLVGGGSGSVPDLGALSVDLGGLVPDASVIVWTRLNF